MPKVIFVTTLPLWSLGKGHGGPAFTQTLKKYIDEGWDVYLVSDEPANVDYPELDGAHNICLKPSVFKKYDQIRKLGLLFRWLDHKVMTRRFIKTIKKLMEAGSEETILYAYEIFGVKAAVKAARETGVPVVSRFQGTIMSQYKNTVFNRIRRYPHFQALSEKTDLVIMTDDGTKGDKVLDELRNDSKRLFLRNGLDLMNLDINAMYAGFDRETFRKELGVSADETLLLTVSRLVPWKKVDRAIEGLASCRANKIRLVIVGDGDCKAELASLVEKRNVSDKVIFAGAVAHDDVYRYMMACDIFISLYDLSNVGNPLLEAMTLGKCIVTLDVGDTSRLISNKENGILLNYQNLNSLGSVISELSENEKLRKDLGDKAANFAQENFYSWEKRMDVEFKAVSGLLEHK